MISIIYGHRKMGNVLYARGLLGAAEKDCMWTTTIRQESSEVCYVERATTGLGILPTTLKGFRLPSSI